MLTSSITVTLAGGNSLKGVYPNSYPGSSSGDGNTVAFENTILETDKQINARLVEIANQGPSLETTVTSRLDCHIPDRRQYTNHREHQYQSMYNNQNRSYNNNYNQNYKQTWENHSDRTCNNCGTKGHIAKYCTKTSFWCQWCHTATHDTQACRSKPRSSTPMESPSAGSYQIQKEHFKVPPQPMEFIAMDLIGEFHSLSTLYLKSKLNHSSPKILN